MDTKSQELPGGQDSIPALSCNRIYETDNEHSGEPSDEARESPAVTGASTQRFSLSSSYGTTRGFADSIANIQEPAERREDTQTQYHDYWRQQRLVFDYELSIPVPNAFRELTEQEEEQRQRDDRRFLQAVQQELAAARAELSTVENQIYRANATLLALEDQLLVIGHEVSMADTRLTERNAELRILNTRKSALTDEIYERQDYWLNIVEHILKIAERSDRFSEIHQEQLGARWREDFLFQQQRQAQEAQLRTREEAVAATEAASSRREEAVAASEARLASLRERRRAQR
ncbi:hypothetical protein EDC01DRAFT_630719 [Geopyxis carbonaria]|nr:hypothetical protein EDC01DRAFT_630719 [Geopyxis carbonaria]